MAPCGGFAHTSALLMGFYEAELSKERITIQTLGAIMRRCKSPASTRSIIKRVSGHIKFFLDARDESNVTLTGESPVVLLQDYLESVSDHGGDVPGAVRTALSTWSDALGVPWPLDNPLVRIAAQVESNQTPKHAPPTKLDNQETSGVISERGGFPLQTFLRGGDRPNGVR